MDYDEVELLLSREEEHEDRSFEVLVEGVAVPMLIQHRSLSFRNHRTVVGDDMMVVCTAAAAVDSVDSVDVVLFCSDAVDRRRVAVVRRRARRKPIDDTRMSKLVLLPLFPTV